MAQNKYYRKKKKTNIGISVKEYYNRMLKRTLAIVKEDKDSQSPSSSTKEAIGYRKYSRR
jgi:hypothetical protein